MERGSSFDRDGEASINGTWHTIILGAKTKRLEVDKGLKFPPKATGFIARRKKANEMV